MMLTTTKKAFMVGWCMFFHGRKSYIAKPSLDISGKKGIHCSKCNCDFMVSEKTFSRIIKG